MNSKREPSLAQRREALIATAAYQRQVLAEDCARLTPAVGLVDRGVSVLRWVRRVPAVLAPAAAIAAFFWNRRQKKKAADSNNEHEFSSRRSHTGPRSMLGLGGLWAGARVVGAAWRWWQGRR